MVFLPATLDLLYKGENHSLAMQHKGNLSGSNQRSIKRMSFHITVTSTENNFYYYNFILPYFYLLQYFKKDTSATFALLFYLLPFLYLTNF